MEIYISNRCVTFEMTKIWPFFTLVVVYWRKRRKSMHFGCGFTFCYNCQPTMISCFTHEKVVLRHFKCVNSKIVEQLKNGLFSTNITKPISDFVRKPLPNYVVGFQ